MLLAMATLMGPKTKPPGALPGMGCPKALAKRCFFNNWPLVKRNFFFNDLMITLSREEELLF